MDYGLLNIPYIYQLLFSVKPYVPRKAYVKPLYNKLRRIELCI